jgi:hypothetical protein
LAPVPAGEVNVAVAPDMPARADRTTPAIVDVTFEVVEGVSVIDPDNGTGAIAWWTVTPVSWSGPPAPSSALG